MTRIKALKESSHLSLAEILVVILDFISASWMKFSGTIVAKEQESYGAKMVFP